MAHAYLFVHFKEKKTPDGEQVYFALSRDGFVWETVNDGQPVLWSFLGDRGVRDMTIVTTQEGRTHIIATDLSLAYHLNGKYQGLWSVITARGSQMLSMWSSDDMVTWEPQRMIDFPGTHFGCLWAPDILKLPGGEYLLHWTSSLRENGILRQSIYGSVTRDFIRFDTPRLVYGNPGGSVIDSAIYEEDGLYYLFLKSQYGSSGIDMLRASDPFGPYETVEGFRASLDLDNPGQYEAPTAFKLPDGRWCLMLDYFGVPGKGQGYVPFVSDTLASGRFVRADEAFSFPYGFKHGTVLTIPWDTYERLRAVREWPEVGRPVN